MFNNSVVATVSVDQGYRSVITTYITGMTGNRIINGDVFSSQMKSGEFSGSRGLTYSDINGVSSWVENGYTYNVYIDNSSRNE